MRGRALTWLVTGGYALPVLMALYEWRHRRRIVKPRSDNPWYKEPRAEQWARL